MKICVYGAGVIGSIFAGKLALAGNDVTVIDRGKRLDEIRKSGIILVDSSTNKREKIAVEVAESLSPHDNYDYILVVLQRTQVDDILPLLSQNCSGNIVFAVNTAGGYEKWANAVGAERLMIGFPSAGGEYKDGKIYYFIVRGLQRAFQTTTFGEYSGKKTARVNTLIDLFNQAGIPSVYCSDMDAWMPSKKNGAKNTRLPCVPGGKIGLNSAPSLSIPRLFAGLFTPPTGLRILIAACAK